MVFCRAISVLLTVAAFCVVNGQILSDEPKAGDTTDQSAAPFTNASVEWNETKGRSFHDVGSRRASGENWPQKGENGDVFIESSPEMELADAIPASQSDVRADQPNVLTNDDVLNIAHRVLSMRDDLKLVNDVMSVIANPNKEKRKLSVPLNPNMNRGFSAPNNLDMKHGVRSMPLPDNTAIENGETSVQDKTKDIQHNILSSSESYNRGTKWTPNNGNLDVGTSGNLDVGTSGNLDVGTSGSLDVGTSGSLDVGTSGSLDVGTSGSLDVGTSGSLDVGTSGNLDVGISGNLDVGISGNLDVGTSGNLDVGTSGNLDVGTSGSLDVGTSGNVDVGTSGNLDVGTSGNIDVGTSGSLDVGTSGSLDFGTSGSAPARILLAADEINKGRPSPWVTTLLVDNTEQIKRVENDGSPNVLQSDDPNEIRSVDQSMTSADNYSDSNRNKSSENTETPSHTTMASQPSAELNPQNPDTVSLVGSRGRDDLQIVKGVELTPGMQDHGNSGTKAGATYEIHSNGQPQHLFNLDRQLQLYKIEAEENATQQQQNSTGTVGKTRDLVSPDDLTFGKTSDLVSPDDLTVGKTIDPVAPDHGKRDELLEIFQLHPRMRDAPDMNWPLQKKRMLEDLLKDDSTTNREADTMAKDGQLFTTENLQMLSQDDRKERGFVDNDIWRHLGALDETGPQASMTTRLIQSDLLKLGLGPGNSQDNEMGNPQDNEMGNLQDNVMGNQQDNEMGNPQDNEMGNLQDNVMGNQQDNEMGNQQDNVMGNQQDNEMGNQQDNEMGNQKDKEIGNPKDNGMSKRKDNEMGNQQDLEMGNQQDLVMGNSQDNEMGNQKDNEMDNQKDNEIANQKDYEIANQKDNEIANQQDNERGIQQDNIRMAPPNSAQQLTNILSSFELEKFLERVVFPYLNQHRTKVGDASQQSNYLSPGEGRWATGLDGISISNRQGQGEKRNKLLPVDQYPASQPHQVDNQPHLDQVDAVHPVLHYEKFPGQKLTLLNTFKPVHQSSERALHKNAGPLVLLNALNHVTQFNEPNLMIHLDGPNPMAQFKERIPKTQINEEEITRPYFMNPSQFPVLYQIFNQHPDGHQVSYNQHSDGHQRPFNQHPDGPQVPYNQHSDGHQGPFNQHSDGHQGPFNQHSGGHQGPFNQHSGGHQGPSNQHSGGHQVPFNQHPDGPQVPYNQHSGGHQVPSNQHSGGHQGPSNQHSGGHQVPFNQHPDGPQVPYNQHSDGHQGPLNQHSGGRPRPSSGQVVMSDTPPSSHTRPSVHGYVPDIQSDLSSPWSPPLQTWEGPAGLFGAQEWAGQIRGVTEYKGNSKPSVGQVVEDLLKSYNRHSNPHESYMSSPPLPRSIPTHMPDNFNLPRFDKHDHLSNTNLDHSNLPIYRSAFSFFSPIDNGDKGAKHQAEFPAELFKTHQKFNPWEPPIGIPQHHSSNVAPQSYKVRLSDIKPPITGRKDEFSRPFFSPRRKKQIRSRDTNTQHQPFKTSRKSILEQIIPGPYVDYNTPVTSMSSKQPARDQPVTSVSSKEPATDLPVTSISSHQPARDQPVTSMSSHQSTRDQTVTSMSSKQPPRAHPKPIPLSRYYRSRDSAHNNINSLNQRFRNKKLFLTQQFQMFNDEIKMAGLKEKKKSQVQVLPWGISVQPQQNDIYELSEGHSVELPSYLSRSPSPQFEQSFEPGDPGVLFGLDKMKVVLPVDEDIETKQLADVDPRQSASAGSGSDPGAEHELKAGIHVVTEVYPEGTNIERTTDAVTDPLAAASIGLPTNSTTNFTQVVELPENVTQVVEQPENVTQVVELPDNVTQLVELPENVIDEILSISRVNSTMFRGKNSSLVISEPGVTAPYPSQTTHTVNGNSDTSVSLAQDPVLTSLDAGQRTNASSRDMGVAQAGDVTSGADLGKNKDVLFGSTPSNKEITLVREPIHKDSEHSTLRLRRDSHAIEWNKSRPVWSLSRAWGRHRGELHRTRAKRDNHVNESSISLISVNTGSSSEPAPSSEAASSSDRNLTSDRNLSSDTASSSDRSLTSDTVSSSDRNLTSDTVSSSERILPSDTASSSDKTLTSDKPNMNVYKTALQVNYLTQNNPGIAQNNLGPYEEGAYRAPSEKFRPTTEKLTGETRDLLTTGNVSEAVGSKYGVIADDRKSVQDRNAHVKEQNADMFKEQNIDRFVKIKTQNHGIGRIPPWVTPQQAREDDKQQPYKMEQKQESRAQKHLLTTPQRGRGPEIEKERLGVVQDSTNENFEAGTRDEDGHPTARKEISYADRYLLSQKLKPSIVSHQTRIHNPFVHTPGQPTHNSHPQSQVYTHSSQPQSQVDKDNDQNTLVKAGPVHARSEDVLRMSPRNSPNQPDQLKLTPDPKTAQHDVSGDLLMQSSQRQTSYIDRFLALEKPYGVIPNQPVQVHYQPYVIYYTYPYGYVSGDPSSTDAYSPSSDRYQEKKDDEEGRAGEEDSESDEDDEKDSPQSQTLNDKQYTNTGYDDGYSGTKEGYNGGYSGTKQGYNDGYSGTKQGYNDGYSGTKQGYNGGYTGTKQGYNDGYSGTKQGYNGGYTGTKQGYNDGYSGTKQGYNDGYSGMNQGYNGGYTSTKQGYNGGYGTKQGYNGYIGTNQGYNDGYGGTKQGYNGYSGTSEGYNGGYSSTKQGYNGYIGTNQRYNGGYSGTKPGYNDGYGGRVLGYPSTKQSYSGYSGTKHVSNDEYPGTRQSYRDKYLSTKKHDVGRNDDSGYYGNTGNQGNMSPNDVRIGITQGSNKWSNKNIRWDQLGLLNSNNNNLLGRGTYNDGQVNRAKNINGQNDNYVRDYWNGASYKDGKFSQNGGTWAQNNDYKYKTKFPTQGQYKPRFIRGTQKQSGNLGQFDLMDYTGGSRYQQGDFKDYSSSSRYQQRDLKISKENDLDEDAVLQFIFSQKKFSSKNPGMAPNNGFPAVPMFDSKNSEMKGSHADREVEEAVEQFLYTKPKYGKKGDDPLAGVLNI